MPQEYIVLVVLGIYVQPLAHNGSIKSTDVEQKRFYMRNMFGLFVHGCVRLHEAFQYFSCHQFVNDCLRNLPSL